MRLRVIALVFFLPFAALAQTPPAFEVASIRPSGDQSTTVTAGLRISGAQARIVRLPLKDYIAIAYRVRASQVSGPDWLEKDNYDVTAKIPDNVSSDRVPEMLQALLAERFLLKAHRESRETPVYALVVAKDGVKLKEAETDDAAPAAAVSVTANGGPGGVNVDLGGGSTFSLANSRVEIKKMQTMQMADMLARFLDRPVVDETGLTGRYDLTLELTQEDYTAMLIRSAINAGVPLPPQALRALDNASSDPLSNALQKYGLKLESRRTPLDVIVIDSMQRMPTEN